ncbi:MAG: hypothetical protein EBU93_04630, partial [Chlamydiae bacterium]|nr:hypothetical protein [Chlamydiota bacterium]
MHAFLRRPQEREKIFSGYTSTNTLTPEALLGQRNLKPSFRQATPKPQPKPQPRKTVKVPLEKALDVSYGQGDLSQYGYFYDKSLSNKENKVFYNPYKDDVIFSVAGTNPLNLRDIGTDAYLAFMGQAGLKATNRFKEAEAVIEKARKKYSKASKSLVGHSLGSAIVSGLAKGNENVKGFGTGSGLFPEKQVGETYRTFYDPFSFTSDDTLISPYIPKKKGN